MAKHSNPKLVFVRLKEALHKIDAQLVDVFNYTDENIDLAPLKIELGDISGEDSMLRLAVAGQSNVGKTTLIKALTGEDLFIDADVSTDEILEVRYKDAVSLIDMPGTLSGQLAHDEKAKKAIINSDLMLFVLTNELFNANNYPYFDKAVQDYQKASQTLIVINQFDRVNLRGRTPEDAISLIREQIAERIAPLDIEKFGPVFVSARDFLDSLEKEDPEYKRELEEDSRIASLVQAIDDFTFERGTVGKLARLFQLRLDLIKRAVELASSGEDEQPLLQELLRRKLDCYADVQHTFHVEKRNLLSEIRHRIVNLAGPVLNLVDQKADANEINAEWKETDAQVETILEDTADQLQSLMERSLQNLSRDLQNLDESPVARAVGDFLNREFARGTGNFGRTLSGSKDGLGGKVLKNVDLQGVMNKTGQKIAENSAEISKKIVEIVGKFKKFKPWGKIKLGKKLEKLLGKAGKCIGPIMVLVESYMNYRDEEKAEKREQERLSFKAEVRKALNQIASEAVSELESMISYFDTQCFKEDITQIKKARDTIASLSRERGELTRKLLAEENEVRDSLDLISGVDLGEQNEAL